MNNKLIFKKNCDVILNQSLAYIDVDNNGNLYTVNKIRDLNYRVDYYLRGNESTNYFSLKKEMNFMQIVDDSFLFVSSVSEENENNAFLYNKEGDILNSFYVGSGIEVCRVDDEQRIWIGYSDEGIFAPNSMGENGIVCFDIKGQMVFNNYHLYVDKDDVPPIDHCNAITMSQRDVWLCYYSDNYSLVQMKRDNTVHLLREFHISPVNCLAVGEKEAAIVTTNEIIGLELKTREQWEVTACNEKGEEIKLENFFAFGNQLFGIQDESIYVAHIS